MHAENTAGLNHLPAAAAIPTSFRFGARLGPGSPALGTCLVPIKFNGLGNSASRFEQVDRYFTSNVVPFARPSPAAPPTAAKQIAENAAAKNIAKGLENVVDIRELMHAPFDPGMAIPIVPRSFIVIPQHFERFGRFLELDDGFIVVGIAVGMKLHGQLAISVGNFFVRGSALNAQNFVIIAFRWHRDHGGEHRQLARRPIAAESGINQIILRHAPNSVSVGLLKRFTPRRKRAAPFCAGGPESIHGSSASAKRQR